MTDTQMRDYDGSNDEDAGALRNSLEEANMYLDILIHDINNANTATLGYAELIRENTSEEDSVYFSEMIAGINRSSNIITNIVRMRKAGKNPPETVAVSLDEAISSAASRVNGIELEYAGSPFGVLSCDRNLLSDVFSIILENSRIYGGDGVHVEISASEKDGRIIVTITDDGPGIPDEKKEILFRRFQSDCDGRRGRGLGLPVCWYILNRCGGSISAADRIEGDPSSGLKITIGLDVA